MPKTIEAIPIPEPSRLASPVNGAGLVVDGPTAAEVLVLWLGLGLTTKLEVGAAGGGAAAGDEGVTTDTGGGTTTGVVGAGGGTTAGVVGTAGGTTEVVGAGGGGAGDAGGVTTGGGTAVVVTGQIVVPIEMVSVVTCGPAGQFVTVGAQEVTVYTLVV